MAVRSQKEYDLKKNEIIRSAKKLLLEKGIEDTTIQDIADESGFSRVTVYSYFKNKDDMIFYIFAETGMKHLEFIDKNLDKKKNGLDQIYSIGESFYKFFKKYPLNIRLRMYTFLYDANQFEKNLSKTTFNNLLTFFDTGREVIRDSIRLGIKDGSIRKDIDVVNTNIHFIGSMMDILKTTILTNVYLFKKKSEIKKVFYDFLDLFIRGIKA